VKKLPKAQYSPSTDKHPKVATEPEDFYSRFPSWRIARVQFCTPWGWHGLTTTEVQYVHEKLSHFERMTWREILMDSKKQNHSVGVWQLCSAAQKRLEELGYGDLKRITSLRLAGRERVWGVMQEGVLAVLWWDPNHEVYSVEKRNT
jgi:hypothetical protein